MSHHSLFLQMENHEYLMALMEQISKIIRLLYLLLLSLDIVLQLQKCILFALIFFNCCTSDHVFIKNIEFPFKRNCFNAKLQNFQPCCPFDKS